MDSPETLPLIEEIAPIFPNEWLAFIVPPAEDESPVPTHGKLVAHSPNPDEIFDATNMVLWNQYVYTFFNGDFEAMEASYGDTLNEAPKKVSQPFYVPEEFDIIPVPEKLLDLTYSALDYLYKDPPNTSEAIRRLRIAKVRLSYKPDSPLLPILDAALDGLESAEIDDKRVIWQLEESMTTFKATI